MAPVRVFHTSLYLSLAIAVGQETSISAIAPSTTLIDMKGEPSQQRGPIVRLIQPRMSRGGRTV